MSAFLDVHGTRVAYSDAVITNNPQKRAFDLSSHRSGLVVENPRSEQTTIAPGETWHAFQTCLELAADATTQYSLRSNTYRPSSYRLEWTGTGTAPGFRQERTIVYPAEGAEVEVKVNNTVTATFRMAVDLSAVKVGDHLFIPGVSTGDGGGVFSEPNCGLWVVLGATADSLVCRRPVGQVFQGVDEKVRVSKLFQFQVMAAGGVQVGDTLELGSGFGPIHVGSYRVSAVTSRWVEFLSSEPLPLIEAIVPGPEMLKLYRLARRYLYLEVDQPALVTLNKGTGFPIQPLQNGDSERTGWFELWSHVWSCEVTNRSTTAHLNCHLLSAE